MIELFRRKDKYLDENCNEIKVEYKYQLNENGLKELANINWENAIDYSSEIGGVISQMRQDINYLHGVADTMQNPDRVKEIARNIEDINNLIGLAYLIEKVEVKND